jgi:hypothetical protein
LFGCPFFKHRDKVLNYWKVAVAVSKIKLSYFNLTIHYLSQFNAVKDAHLCVIKTEMAWASYNFKLNG